MRKSKMKAKITKCKDTTIVNHGWIPNVKNKTKYNSLE